MILKNYFEKSRKWLLERLKIAWVYCLQCIRQIRRKPVRAIIAALIASGMGLWLGPRAGVLWLLFLLFLVYEWENRIIGVLALISLASCPFLLSFHQDDFAETMAVYAYFFLVMTVALQIVEYKRHPERFEEGGDMEIVGSPGLRQTSPEDDTEGMDSCLRRNDTRGCKDDTKGARGWILACARMTRGVARMTEGMTRGWGDRARPVLLFLRSYWPYILAIVLMLLFLGPVLLPGYVMTLDMVWAPTIHFPSLDPGAFANSIPIHFIFYVLGIIAPSWIVQKLFIILLFSLIFFLSYKFLLPESTSKPARILSALFYTINPFVYTRFLAGHWLHLLAYAFLPLLFVIPKFTGLKRGFYWGLIVATIFSFSMQLGIMSLLVSGFLLLASIKLPTPDRATSYELRATSFSWWKTMAAAGLVFLVATSYWTIPYLLHSEKSIVQVFDQRHMEAFKTVSDQYIGTVGNVLALYGFWGEREPWVQQFVWVKSFPIVWSISGLILISLILLGMFVAFKNRNLRKQGVAMAVIGLLAVVFSCGIADSPFKPINLWLFNHVGLWSGFRDTQKWSALIALVYAFFMGLGIDVILSGTNVKSKDLVWSALQNGPDPSIPSDSTRDDRGGRGYRLTAIVLCVSAILTYTFPMLFGFWGQLKPVWYPESWKQANEVLSKDKSCKALFLPWHEYFSLNFNHGLLTASPARDYFDCEMVTSRQVELGNIGAQSLPDPAYDAIDGLATGTDKWKPDEAINVLRQAGIKYVIFTDDVKSEDQWTYEFLNSQSLDKVSWDHLTMYKIKE